MSPLALLTHFLMLSASPRYRRMRWLKKRGVDRGIFVRVREFDALAPWDLNWSVAIAPTGKCVVRTFAIDAGGRRDFGPQGGDTRPTTIDDILLAVKEYRRQRRLIPSIGHWAIVEGGFSMLVVWREGRLNVRRGAGACWMDPPVLQLLGQIKRLLQDVVTAVPER